jgi:hypothetical protein
MLINRTYIIKYKPKFFRKLSQKLFSTMIMEWLGVYQALILAECAPDVPSHITVKLPIIERAAIIVK